jgi:hypothetical protein
MSSYARQRAFEASQRQKKLEAENARQAGLLQSQGSDDAAVQSLLGQYVNQDLGNTLGSAEFGKIRQFAFSGTEDPVFAAQRGAAGTAAEAQRARTRADALAALQGQDRSLAGQTANAYSQLAMGGGLSSGSRERIAAGAANQNLMARQNLRGEEMRGLTSIGTAEQGALGELGVAEAKARQDAQMRVTDALAKEEARRVQLRQDILGKKLETEGALLKAKRETAISEQNKPSDNCYITTAVCESAGLPDDCPELTALRAFRDSFMLETAERLNALKTYYATAPGIVARIRSMPSARTVFYGIRTRFIEPCLQMLHTGDMDGCFRHYKEMMATVDAETKEGAA